MPALSKVPYGVIGPVVPKVAEIIAATGNRVTHVWGYGPNPDHNNKRCADLMVRSIADGNVVADYVWRNRARLGVRLMIWNHRIISTYRASSGRPAGVWWRYNGPSPHTDHPHVEFDSSDYKAPVGGAAAPSAVTSTPAAKPAATTEKGLLMGAIRKFGNGKKRTIKNDSRWHTQDLNGKGAYSIASGPADALATVQVQAVIPDGATLQIRLTEVLYKKGTKTKIVKKYPVQAEQVHTSGKTFLTTTFLDTIAAGTGGASRRLRYQVCATGGPVTIERSWVRVTTTK